MHAYGRAFQAFQELSSFIFLANFTVKPWTSDCPFDTKPMHFLYPVIKMMFLLSFSCSIVGFLGLVSSITNSRQFLSVAYSQTISPGRPWSHAQTL